MLHVIIFKLTLREKLDAAQVPCVLNEFTSFLCQCYLFITCK